MLSDADDLKRVACEIDVDVPVSEVFAAVSDPRNYGRWSPEASGADLPTANPLRTGDRFTGHSRLWVPWNGHCTVVDVVPEQRFSFEVRVLGVRAARWTYETRATATGTHVTEIWDDLRTGVTGTLIKPSGLLVGRGISARKRNAVTMAETLRRLKSDLESQPHS